MNHHGASPDHAQGADVAAGHDGCPDADEGSAANGHLAAQMHPRGNVRVRSDVIMMVGSASRIQDDVSTDRAPGLIMAPAQIMLPGPISTSGATMALGWRATTKRSAGTASQTDVGGAVVSNRHNDSIVRNGRYLVDRPQDRQGEKLFPCSARLSSK